MRQKQGVYRYDDCYTILDDDDDDDDDDQYSTKKPGLIYKHD